MICLGLHGCDGGLRHALGFADELRRRVLTNKEPMNRVARSLGLEGAQVRGVIRLLRSTDRPISAERLALVLMKDPGMENADVAEVFGRPIRWASLVRLHADEIRAAEPLNPDVEWIDDGLQPDYPMPDEIARRAMEVRGMSRLTGCDRRNRLSGIRQYYWSRNGAVFSVGAG